MRPDSPTFLARRPRGHTGDRRCQASRQILSRRRFWLDGLHFYSRNEAACAALMERYLGYRCIEGLSFQVPMGTNLKGGVERVDFLIFDAVLEFYSVLPSRSPIYWKMLRRLGPGQRQKLRELWTRNQELRFIDARRMQLDEYPQLSNAELIVVCSPEAFYERVIVRFMREKHLAPFRRIPLRDAFMREFREILGKVKERKAQRIKRMRVRSATR